MSIIPRILDYNNTFVDQKEYQVLHTTKYPNKKLVILTCMDTRLLELLPKAMGMQKLLKTLELLSPTLSAALCAVFL